MNGKKAYKDWHWGIEPTEVVEIEPPPCVRENPRDVKQWDKMKLVECGRLVEIHYAPINSSSRRKNTILKLNRSQSNQCHLCFDLDHDNQRLYFILSDGVREFMFKKLENGLDYLPLAEIAKETGGLHATDDYENIECQPIGVMTHVVYACEKKGDGYSFYIHALGEESGIRPVLAMADDGSIWFAGGNYTAPIQGITD